ncbi:MAG: lysophospholipid acyltransferase family protein [Pseudomonadales bacterium]
MTEIPLTKPRNQLVVVIRTLGFCLGYPAFALGCLLLALYGPLSKLGSQDDRRRVIRMRLVAHRLAHHYLRLLMLLRIVQVSWDQPRVLPAGMIIANHPSLIDVIWILSTQPDITLVLKSDLERFAILRYLAHRLDYISNSDPEALLQAGTAKLKAGETLLVFPEATRTKPDEPVKFRLGAAEMAIRAGVPIHPIIIHKQGRYLSKSCPWYEFPEEKLYWRIEHADTIPAVATTAPRQARRTLTARLQQDYRTRLGQSNGCTSSGGR